jgi:hypothetical protein
METELLDYTFTLKEVIAIVIATIPFFYAWFNFKRRLEKLDKWQDDFLKHFDDIMRKVISEIRNGR